MVKMFKLLTDESDLSVVSVDYLLIDLIAQLCPQNAENCSNSTQQPKKKFIKKTCTK